MGAQASAGAPDHLGGRHCTGAGKIKKTKFTLPAMHVFKDEAEIAEMSELDHRAECAKYNEDGTLK